jgi:serine/threonine protein kinase
MTNRLPDEPGQTGAQDAQDQPTVDERALNDALLEFIDRSTTEESLNVVTFCNSYPQLGVELRSLLDAFVALDSDSDEIAGSGDFDQGRVDDDPLPDSLSGHKILGEIGTGGMGRVLLAYDDRLRRKVAIKTLRSKFRESGSLKTRFMQEARALAQLHHPNIVSIYYLGKSDEPPHFVMEFVEGVTMLEAARALTLEQKAELMQKVALAVEFLHRHSLLHRDLKPANVLVGSDLEPKLLDFGLASHVDGRHGRITDVGDVIGTPDYFSPEQTRPGARLDARSDVFSLGTVFYELLTGTLPFRGESYAERTHSLREVDPVLPRRLNPALPGDLQNICLKALEKNPSDRYASAKEMADDLERFLAKETVLAVPTHLMSEKIEQHQKPNRLGAVTGAALLLSGLALGGWWFFSGKSHALTDKDTIVLADFTNVTGDAVFDGALRQGLSVQLEQSPFLSIISDQQIQQTLQMMGQKPDAKVTPEIARELCQRTSGTAVLDGSIAQIGTQYLLTLRAVSCSSGETLASTEAQASDKDHVLDALGKTASDIRSKLGESISTVQKFDTPLVQATTSSLAALKAYSRAYSMYDEQGGHAAVDYFRRAVELDPNFALAYGALGNIYASDLLEPGLAAVNLRTAYELRERVSEREKFEITANYHLSVTGEMDKAVQALKSWAEAYPREDAPHTVLGYVYGYEGKYEDEVKEELESVRLAPNFSAPYSNLMDGYIPLGRLAEAKEIGHRGLDRKLEGQFLRDNLYAVAFLENDTAEMKREVDAVGGQPGVEDLLLSGESDSGGYFGRLTKARELSTQAVKSAQRADEKETAGLWRLNSSLREAEFGNMERARQEVKDGLAIASTRDVQTLAALSLACTGNLLRARAIADDLQKQFPRNTMLNQYWLPVIRAYANVRSGHPSQALELLQDAAPYDLAFPLPQFSEGGTLYPSYVRGLAYLALHEGKEAAAEFQKFIDHRTVVVNFALAPLARLQLARAYALQGETAKAKAAYQDFLTLWKDADPDIPIFKQAKAEYAKLQ